MRKVRMSERNGETDVKLLVEKAVRLRREEKDISDSLKKVKAELLKQALKTKATEYVASDGSKIKVIPTTSRKIGVLTVYNRIKELFKGAERRDAIKACFKVSLENVDTYLSKLWVDKNLDEEKTSAYLKIDLN